MNKSLFPVGKLPTEKLEELLGRIEVDDHELVLGPGVGLDCAVIDVGSRLLVLKSDPITFASENAGWYLVHVNANDISTMGAQPRWLLLTMLLPEKSTSNELVNRLAAQIKGACDELGVNIIGGHTEITHGLDRPILVGTMIGEVAREKLITPKGIQPGDHILLTKSVPIEATSLMAYEVPDLLAGKLNPDQIAEARNYLHDPGISVLRDAKIAVQAGNVTGMHDPTEGGLAGALWELADASGCQLVIEISQAFVSELSKMICEELNLNPYASISSGSLLIASKPDSSATICRQLRKSGIRCSKIGLVEIGDPFVWQQTGSSRTKLHRPHRDEISKIFERRME